MTMTNPTLACAPDTASRLRILIPVYQAQPDPLAIFSLDRTLTVLGQRGCTFIAPRGLDVSFYAERYRAQFVFFDSAYFRSVLDYSRLLVSDFFYETFQPAEYLLIAQTDIYVFHDALDAWMNRGIDYVGAPWPMGIELNIQVGKFAAVGGKVTRAFVGNGGFSLRRRQACLDLLREHREIADWFLRTGSNEDLFFSLIGSVSENFLVPNQMMAARFALELNPEHYMALNGGQLPMAVHAFEKHNPAFWQNHMPAWPEC